MRSAPFITLAFAALCCFLVAACGLTTTPIGTILDNPRNYDGKMVRVSGEVTDAFSMFVIKYFVIKDRTGEITVISSRPLPRKGSKITVRGRVQEAFSLGDRSLVVIVEPAETETR